VIVARPAVTMEIAGGPSWPRSTTDQHWGADPRTRCLRKSVTWVLSSTVRVDFADRSGLEGHVDVDHNRVPLPSPKEALPDGRHNRRVPRDL
jgi:hypothetical protein